MNLQRLWRVLLPLLSIVVLGGAIYFFTRSGEKEQAKELTTLVKKGQFKIHVNATGELQAKRSVKIRGPKGMRTVQIWQTTISDMIPEGTVVKKGDYVASLDQTELATKLKETQTEIDKILTQMEQTKIDTAINLRGIRDQLINLKFSMEEKKLQVQQSQFEPKMVIRQSEIDLERAQRDFIQLEEKYKLTQTKSDAQISEILTNLKKFEIRLQQLQEISAEFNVIAPEDGMVIYARDWDGSKVVPGGQVSSWDPVVAELPDLSDMISKTFVNEVDISKIQKGQNVKIKIDAFPDNSYQGQVIQVANIGEELRGYDAKVFEVIIQMSQSDSILRPAMTTANEILTYTFEDVLYVPLEALYSDSLTYVYKKTESGIVKQEVLTSEANDNEVIIEYGLKENDEIFMTTPENSDKIQFSIIEKNLKTELQAKIESSRHDRQAAAMEKAKTVKEENINTDEGGGGGIIIIN